MENTIKILEYAMTMEKQGQQFYLKYKDEFKSEKAKRIFENLAKVEAEHYKILKQEYEAFVKGEKSEQFDVTLSGGDTIFEEAMKQEQDLMTPDSEAGLNELAIMRMAYLIENDFAEFYKHVAEQATSEDAKKLFSTLAHWENKHRELFYREYQDLMHANWGEQRFAPF
jgi:rubrerythrin